MQLPRVILRCFYRLNKVIDLEITRLMSPTRAKQQAVDNNCGYSGIEILEEIQ